MSLVERDYMVEQVSPTSLNPALRYSILPRTLARRLASSDVHRPDGHRNFQAILLIAIEDQKVGSGLERERLSQLLDNPHACWMLRDVEVQDAPAVMPNNEQAVERTECNRRHSEKVHRRDGFAMIRQKRQPTLRWLEISWRSRHPAGDCSLGNIE